MPIRYSGAPYYYTQLRVRNRDEIMDGLRDAFVASGWSYIGLTPAWLEYVYNTNNSVNNGFITISSSTVTNTYTAKTTVTDPLTQFQVVAGDPTATWDNFTTLINTRDPLVTAYHDHAKTSVKITARTSGVTNYTLNATNSPFFGIFGGGNTMFRGGYVVQSALSPHGLQCRMRIVDAANPVGSLSRVQTYMCSDDETFVGNVGEIIPDASRLIEFLGCKYQYFTWLLSSTGTGDTTMLGGVPFIRAAHVAPQLTAVANDGTGQVQVTLSVAHGLTTGDHVFLNGVRGIESINSWWQITVVDATNYILQGSTYTPGWNIGTGRAAGPQQISRALWSQSNYTSNALGDGTWRGNIGGGGANTTNCVNQFAYVNGGHNLMTTVLRQDRNALTANFGDYSDIIEPRIAWPIASSSGTVKIVGELWNAFIMTHGFDPDTLKNGFDSHNWIQFGPNDGFISLWLVKT